MTLYMLALLIGVVAGLRAMTAPAAVSWAASLGLLTLDGSWLAVLGYRFTPWILTLLAALSWRGSWPEPPGRSWARWEARPPGRAWPACSVGTAPPLCWRTPWRFLVRHSS